MIKRYTAIGIVSAAAIAFIAYQSYQAGYEARDAIAVKALADSQQEILRIKAEQEKAAKEADAKYQGLKDETDVAISNLSSVNDRLRVRTEKAIHERNEAIASGRINEAGADWIGAFGACYSEYTSLGKDASRIADKLRGLQEYVK